MTWPVWMEFAMSRSIKGDPELGQRGSGKASWKGPSALSHFKSGTRPGGCCLSTLMGVALGWLEAGGV